MNNEIKVPTMQVTPLKKICMTIGELPTSYLETMTYYEMLVWFTNYLRDNIIPVVNNNGEATHELQVLFTELQSYVNNYFDNLDVQDEINNKLDQMLEDGVLEQIIEQFIQSTALWCFDNVAAMKNSTNLINGSYAKTLGYYEVNDGGYATYKITNTQSQTEYQELLNNGLYATLITNGEINVKQLGAKGDGVTNDDLAFQKLSNINAKTINIPHGTYLVEAVVFPSGKINGNNSTINCLFETQRLINFSNNSIINNLHIHSLNNDKEWNRIDLRNKSFIEFNNCKFSGFQQQEVAPNASGLNVWALYFRDCHDIRVINCEFENNNFQDIIIEFNVSNLYFENLQRNDEIFDGVVVDIEPSEENTCKNITFINCNLNDLEVFEYFNTLNQVQNVKILDSRIGKLMYHGGDLTIENCKIESIDANSFLPHSGNLNLINSVNFSNNLITDNYFATVGNQTTGDWIMGYVSASWLDFVNRTKDSENGIVLNLNKNNIAGECMINSKAFTCQAGEIYLLKTLCKSKYPYTAGTPISQQIAIMFYNNSDTNFETWNVSINRSTRDTETKFKYSSNIFKIPENCTYFKIRYRCENGWSKHSLHLINSSLYKITCSTDTNNIVDLPKVNKLKFTFDSKPSDDRRYPNFFVGDTLQYTAPSTYIGSVCTVDGNTWKDFGSIES